MPEPDRMRLVRLIAEAQASLNSADRDLIVRYMLQRALSRCGLAVTLRVPLVARHPHRHRPRRRSRSCRRDPQSVRRGPR